MVAMARLILSHSANGHMLANRTFHTSLAFLSSRGLCKIGKRAILGIALLSSTCLFSSSPLPMDCSGRLIASRLFRKEPATSILPFPLGPYHPALTQPVALTLAMRDETIIDVRAPDAPADDSTPTTGYCRRGAAALCIDRTPADALAILERSCSLAGEAHRLAGCLALEAVTQTEAPTQARIARTLFVKIERILARLWTLGQTARAAEEQTPFHEAMEQRELLFGALEATTGARMFWGVAQPGGARTDLTLAPLREALDRFAPTIETWRVVTGSDGPLGRIGARLGQLGRSLANELGVQGLAACGAGVATLHDLRKDAPYDGYQDVAIEGLESSIGQTARTNDTTSPNKVSRANRASNGNGQRGDVAARMRCAADDIALSVRLVQACFEELGEEPTWENAAVRLRPGSSEVTVEGPHGPATVALALDARGVITDLRLTTPAAATLAATPALLTERPLAEAAVILASLDLCL